MIKSAQGYVSRAVNSSMVLLYWNIGKTIRDEIVKAERADYGKAILEELSSELSIHFGKGYSRPNLNRMVEFYKYFPDPEICATMSHKLS